MPKAGMGICALQFDIAIEELTNSKYATLHGHGF